MQLVAKIKVIIVGGGFGGVKAALELSKHSNFEVTLISSDNHFTYYPQLYHAATGGTYLESSIPLTQILAGKRIKLVRDTATSLNVGNRTLQGQSGTEYAYD